MSGNTGNLRFFPVIIDLEMIGFQDAPVKLFILNLIAPEIKL